MVLIFSFAHNSSPRDLQVYISISAIAKRKHLKDLYLQAIAYYLYQIDFLPYAQMKIK